MDMDKYREEWGARATKAFKGRVVKEIRYPTPEEAQGEFGFYRCPPIVVFEDGAEIVASADDEGNDAGAFFTNHPDIQTIPTI